MPKKTIAADISTTSATGIVARDTGEMVAAQIADVGYYPTCTADVRWTQAVHHTYPLLIVTNASCC